jgi:hypothetical protein
MTNTQKVQKVKPWTKKELTAMAKRELKTRKVSKIKTIVCGLFADKKACIINFDKAFIKAFVDTNKKQPK